MRHPENVHSDPPVARGGFVAGLPPHAADRRRGRRRPRASTVVIGAVVLLGLLTSCDPTPVMLQGTVTTEMFSTAAGGVTVSVYADDSETFVTETVTAVDGRYRFHESVLPDGTYRLRFGDDRWWPNGAMWSDAAPVPLNTTAPTTVDLGLESIGSLSGTIVDGEGDPLVSILAVAIRTADDRVVATADSDEAGLVTLHLTAPGDHQVMLVDPSGTHPTVAVGGGTPAVFAVVAGDAPLGTIDVSTGLPFEPPPHAATQRVSVSSDGDQANGFAFSRSSISADGRYVAFSSEASNLVPGDTNGREDIFVHDRQTSTTTRVSVSSTGTQTDFASTWPSISADGSRIAFESVARNLIAGDTNTAPDIYVHDRTTGTTSRVSVTSAGAQATGFSTEPAISGDGAFVAFKSTARNLVSPDTYSGDDIYVHEIATAVTTRVSVGTDGTQSLANSASPAINHDGRHIAFASAGLGWGGSGGIWVRDRLAGTTTSASFTHDGSPANGYGFRPSISDDGRLIAFHTETSNHVPGDTNGVIDVFVSDMDALTITRVSVATDGGQADTNCLQADISGDGTHVVFDTAATTLDPSDTNGVLDVYLRETTGESTVRVSLAEDGSEGNGESAWPELSADGGLVLFASQASNLVVDDTNGLQDLFVRELLSDA